MTETHPLLGILEQVDIALIDTDDNRRPIDMAHVEELKKSILERGLIQPIAVYHPPSRPRYKLLAGRHRYHACKELYFTAINARVFDVALDEYQLKAIELYENIHRKDLTGPELSQQTERLHSLMQRIYGPAIPGKATGHALKDTARMLGKSVGSIHGDIKLAKAMEQFPELHLEKIPNKVTAMRVLQRFASTISNQEAAKSIVGSQTTDKVERLMNAYNTGDFFDNTLQPGTFSLIEIDPPYGIDLIKVKRGIDRQRLAAYSEIDGSEYRQFLAQLLDHVYTLASENCWVILWHACQWYADCIAMLSSAGFKAVSVPAIWKKGNAAGQTNLVDMNLGNAYESFIYARKGSPRLHILGRSNVFDYSPVSEGQKIHPTERPLELMRDILNTFTTAGSAVLSPFLGSGNVLLAADELHMPCVGYELSEVYHNAFVSRVHARFNN